MNPEHVLTDEEIKQHLNEAFERFAEDSSDQLCQWDFTRAWMFLRLKGDEADIHNS